MSLEDWLKKGASVGLHESTSEFTINSAKALDKLAKHQLPEPGLWLVKLVQAAVVLESQEIKVTLERQVVGFQCRFQGLPCEPSQIFRDFLSGALPTDPFRLHWVTGMRGSLGEDTLDAELVIEQAGERYQVRIHGQGTDVEKTEVASTPDGLLVFRTKRPVVWPGLGRALSLPMKYLFRRVADEYVALHNYCWPVGSRLVIDGRSLEHRYRPSPEIMGDGIEDWNADYANSSKLVGLQSMLLCRTLPLSSESSSLRWHWQPSMGPDCLVLEHNSKIRISRETYRGECWMLWSDVEDDRACARLMLLLGSELDSRVEFLWDGAIIDTLSLPWNSSRLKMMGYRVPQNEGKLGLRVVVPVGSESVDASHFKVRDKEALLTRLLPNLAEDVLESLSEIEQNLSARKNWPVSRDLLTFAKAGLEGLGLGSVGQKVSQSLIRAEIESLQKSIRDTL